ncbi:hypothetical protein [Nesterenkonia flava]|uniref:DUF4232 domain-containing protein n=1 Tax=Nesterenkonia flava TaxID=469799 RepID=A0ABU1FU67_9MICC|nr:hypothetical protein [Nesterenkonia flava]MDR5712209.1 hypothetical protein [Nesterenkonia flava]
MNSQPRRRPSPAVYRRRRLVVGLAGILVLVLLIWGVSSVIGAFTNDDAETEPAGQASDSSGEAEGDSAGSESGGEGEASSPSPTAESSPTPEEEPVPEGYCAPSDVRVTASTRQETYAADEAPLLIMEIENAGSEACTLDVGTSQQVFSIRHGGREIFNTAQCGSRGRSLEMEFEPGQTERAQLTWPRSDSSISCTEPAELPGGTYELTVRVSGISSEPYPFEMKGHES